MRSRTTWLVFAVASAVVAAVMLGVTWGIVRLDDSRTATRRDAAREELVRLALWRMDGVLTPVLSREIAEAGVPVAEGGLPRGVRARFMIHPDGRAETIGAADADVQRRLAAIIAAQEPARTLLALDDAVRDVAGTYRRTKGGPQQQVVPPQQQTDRAALDYDKRVANLQDNLVQSLTNNPTYKAANDEREAVDGEGRLASAVGHLRDDAGRVDREPAVPVAILELMRPLWWGDELVMVRRVQSEAGERIDGAWLDWPLLAGDLHREIADLLPTAKLVPTGSAQGSPARRLATLPLELDAGVVPLPDDASSAPLVFAIAAAWAFVVVAFVAVAMLLRGSLALSERRAEFVSAVTHELRTPLTTFRMYTEMLAGGMVEPSKRERYLETLRREAERLGQLVENVLGYARIEVDDGRRAPSHERTTAGELLARCSDRLHERCRRADLELAIALDDDAAAASLDVDAVAFEQIVFNLVDNAAKYGASAAAPTIEIFVRVVAAYVEVEVRDHGPGIPAADRRRVFDAFAKGAAHQSGTKPGVGLGLALARRLAASMDGRLELRAAARGAVFVLSLPRA
jgi:signal transduction histidine kinase